MKHFALSVVALLSCLLFAACEQVDIPSLSTDEANVVLRISTITQMPFDVSTRADGGVGDVCSRLNIAIFNAQGEKLKTLSQTSDDAGFGTVGLTLAEGEYQAVVIGHNGTSNASIKSADEVSFPNNKLTDTFSTVVALHVGTEKQDVPVALKRCVAMVRLVMTDKTLPDNFAEMEFYYTGGSSTLNALTGLGAKQSRQTETRLRQDAKTDSEGNLVFEVYTIPHAESDVLDMKITAKETDGKDIKVLQWGEIPIKLNTITQCRGEFFGSSQPQSDTALMLSINAVWGETNTIDF